MSESGSSLSFSKHGSTYPNSFIQSGTPFASRPSSTPSLLYNHTINLPPSMETQVRKMKLNLEPYRELVLICDNILLWKHPTYPWGIVSVSTALTIWLYLNSLPTLVNIITILLCGIVADCVLPMLLRLLYPPHKWSGEKQQKYEDICMKIVFLLAKVELIWSAYARIKVTHPRWHFGTTVTLLLVISWMGLIVDNLILFYIVTTGLLMVPGMLQKGMLTKVSHVAGKLYNELVERAVAKGQYQS